MLIGTSVLNYQTLKTLFSPNSRNKNYFFKKIWGYTFFLLYMWDTPNPRTESDLATLRRRTAHLDYCKQLPPSAQVGIRVRLSEPLP